MNKCVLSLCFLICDFIFFILFVIQAEKNSFCNMLAILFFLALPILFICFIVYLIKFIIFCRKNKNLTSLNTNQEKNVNNKSYKKQNQEKYKKYNYSYERLSKDYKPSKPEENSHRNYDFKKNIVDENTAEDNLKKYRTQH